MGFPDHRTLNVVLTTLLVAGVGIVVYRAWPIILVFVLAIFFAYLINPVVKFLQRHSLIFSELQGSGGGGGVSGVFNCDCSSGLWTCAGSCEKDSQTGR